MKRRDVAKVRLIRLLLLGSALGASGLGLRTAAAQSVCFPVGGGGVPGLPGLPDWWTGSAPYDDPRWIGSYGYSYGASEFNALVDTTGGAGHKALVLRWHVKADPGTAGPGDQVWVGFYNPTATTATVFEFQRDILASTDGGVPPEDGGARFFGAAFTRPGTSGTWSSAPVPAAIFTQARLDAFCDTTVDPVTCDEWVIRLRIPMSASDGGIDLGDTFDMWYETDIVHSDTHTADWDNWPVGAAIVDPTADPLTFPEPLGSSSPSSVAWNNVSTVGGTCVAGVGIVSQDIKVTNAIGTGTAIDVNSTNNFDVKPTNHTTTPFNPNAIQARLRLADWGSAIGDSPLWAVPDPTCNAATGSGPAGSITGGTQFDLKCSWTLTAGQKCDYRPDLFPGCTTDALGPRYPHQCIMAELSSTAAPIQISPSSAWNNFDFDHSSKLERKARIDIGSLGPRDVYVYIKTNNMPEKLPPEETPGTPPPRQPPNRELSAGAKERMGALAVLQPGRVTEKDAQALAALVAAGRITYDDVAKVMPTYTAYVWRDDGKTAKTRSGPAKSLVSQPSFTLFVSHDGPLTGWKHAFSGLGGVTVTELARNFYRIGVSAHTVEVLTSVDSIVTPNPPPPRSFWIYILGLLLLLIIIWIIVRIVRH
jgi:hypothetical protein